MTISLMFHRLLFYFILFYFFLWVLLLCLCAYVYNAHVSIFVCVSARMHHPIIMSLLTQTKVLVVAAFSFNQMRLLQLCS